MPKQCGINLLGLEKLPQLKVHQTESQSPSSDRRKGEGPQSSRTASSADPRTKSICVLLTHFTNQN